MDEEKQEPTIPETLAPLSKVIRKCVRLMRQKKRALSQAENSTSARRDSVTAADFCAHRTGPVAESGAKIGGSGDVPHAHSASREAIARFLSHFSLRFPSMTG